MTHESSSSSYLVLHVGGAIKASDKCSGYGRAENPTDITRIVSKDCFLFLRANNTC